MTPENAAALGRAIAENAWTRGTRSPEDASFTASDLGNRYARELGNDPQDCAEAGADAGRAAAAKLERFLEIERQIEAERAAEANE